MTDSHPLDRFPPELGARPAERRRVITQAVISAYAEASGDHNPIHLDLDYARRSGLPATIAHGLLTLGTACAGIESWAGNEGWVARVFCRFSAPVPAGEGITTTALVSAVEEDSAIVDLTVLTSTGERALTKAKVELRAS
ncbi:MAG TPA: MaoC family dehydratase [Candidatus Dormibacteraeota bacterium]|nr:MaoC family dehydratase [Candidatus Dormibacteraeota bacterium]